MRPARHDDFRLPDLRFVPVEGLVPHERHDPQRLEPLVRQLRSERTLRNPPVVTPLSAAGSAEDRTRGADAGAARFMVLDGANRATAARQAELPHIVVQVVEYEEPTVRLSTWHHALAGDHKADLLEACRSTPGLEGQETPILHARALLARREILAYAARSDGTAVALQGGRTLEERNQLLNAVVDSYRSRVRFYRMSTESFEVARERHPDVGTLVVFPHFQPAEVLELAGNGERLPAGITRHLVRWRALRINIPLERLADGSRTTEEKNRWLEEWMQERWTRRQVRFYEESTVLFDE